MTYSTPIIVSTVDLAGELAKKAVYSFKGDDFDGVG